MEQREQTEQRAHSVDPDGISLFWGNDFAIGMSAEESVQITGGLFLIFLQIS